MADLLGFESLTNTNRTVSANYRLWMQFYPQPDRHPLMYSRPTSHKRVISFVGADSQAGCVDFSWDKQMGQPSGKWSAIFKTTPQSDFPIRFDRMEVMDGDWVDIAIIRNGYRIPLCRGVVDSVREHSRSLGGATVREWMVTGRDHGAVFEMPITWTQLWIRSLGDIVGPLFMYEAGGKVGGRPDEVFQLLIDGALGNGKVGGQWELPMTLWDTTGTKTTLHSILKLVALSGSKGAAAAQGLRGSYYNQPQLWATGGQTLHQTLMQWCNPLLNEIYYDLLPPSLPKNGLAGHLINRESGEGSFGQTSIPQSVAAAGTQPGRQLKPKTTSPDAMFGHPAAYIRERPFPSSVEGRDSLWFDLPRWRIPSWIEESVDLEWGGHERYNLFELLASVSMFGPSNEQPPMTLPLWRAEDIKMRGLRVFSQSTPFFVQRRLGEGDWVQERNVWQQLLADWYSGLPYLRQGQDVIKLMLPEVRIGHSLLRVDGDDPEQWEQLYVEHVNLRWKFPPGEAVSTFTLTHGFKGTDETLLGAVQEGANLFKQAKANEGGA